LIDDAASARHRAQGGDHPMTQTLDETIEQVETLYESVTGTKAPPISTTPYAAIPPEKDPDVYVSEQIERLISSLADVAGRPMAVPTWSPALWACYGKETLQVHLDLPGVPRDAVRVRMGNGMLQVTGTRSFPPMEGARCTRHSEQPFGAFQRLIPVPTDVAADQVKAQLKDGVLTIEVPRVGAPAVDGREITVS
jgi:HSP20 family protein